MAKNFPYFKFVATEWLTGDIVYEDFKLQGLFINICALYWQRDGILSIEDLKKRYKHIDLIDELNNRFFTITDSGFISIKFLDEQLIDANHTSKANSENGKKGAEAKRILAEAKRRLSEGQANFSKEKKRKEKKIEENLENVYYREFKHLKITFEEMAKLEVDYEKKHIDSVLDSIENYKKNTNYVSLYLTARTWLKDTPKKVPDKEHPYSDIQIREAKAQRAAGFGVPEWFDKQYLHLTE